LEGNQREKNHEGFMLTSPTKSQREMSQNYHKNSPRKASENHQKREMGKIHPSLEEPHRIIYTYQRGSYKV
jgi:hypothetical protein